jgi:hypothetical protein
MLTVWPKAARRPISAKPRVLRISPAPPERTEERKTPVSTTYLGRKQRTFDGVVGNAT